MRRILPAVIVALMAVPGLAFGAQVFEFPAMQFPSARTDALGGMHAALTDDLSTLLANPAGFQEAKPQLAVSELTMNLTGPIFSITDLVLRIVNGGDPLALIVDPAVQRLLTSLYASGTINGPIAFGYVGDGLGFGFFNSSSVNFSTQGSVPTMTANVQENLMFIGGYAFSIPLPPVMRSTLDVGVTLKAFSRASVGLTQSIFQVFSLFQSFSPSILLAQPFNLDVGFGVDAGILYSLDKVFSIGIVGRNLYSPVMRNSYGSLTAFTGGVVPTTSYGSVPLDLSAGILFTPRLGAAGALISDLKIALDYSDIIDFVTHPASATNPVLHPGLGIEMVMLKILSLRGGFGHGYFSAGLGLDLAFFRLNLAMYGTELSSEPGLRPAYNLLLGLEFRY